MKRLKDGETKVMQREKAWGNKDIRVTAMRVDSETPYVILQLLRHSGEPGIYLADIEAVELCERIKCALSILPTSK